ncbi:uncharacterized protein [Nicotiana sylvestris]|uniref:uncharacterized protein n=1 Tax=Nicotiana sylvestris TaxID=4096 RepID=UPI00388C542E
MNVAEMRMLRWMCGLTRMDKIRNGDIREKVGVAYMEDKMQEARLRWFGHIQKRSTDAPVRRCEWMAVVGMRRVEIMQQDEDLEPKSVDESVYVDDLNIIGTSKELPKDVECLKKEFEMKDLGKTILSWPTN